MEKIFVKVGISDKSLETTEIKNAFFKTETGEKKHWFSHEESDKIISWIQSFNNPVFISNHFMPVEYLFNLAFNDTFITDDVWTKTKVTPEKGWEKAYQHDLVFAAKDEITRYKVLNLYYILQFKDKGFQSHTPYSADEIEILYNKYKELIDDILKIENE